MRLPLLTFVATLVLAACGSDSGGESSGTETAAAPATTGQTNTGGIETTAEPSELPETPITTKLTEGYRVENGSISQPDEADLPVKPDTVEARWYKAGDRWAVVYVGVPEDPGPICPGNSILVGSSYESVSNSPVEQGVSCGSATLAAKPAGVQKCGSNLVYVTEIPAKKEGVLSSTIERFEGSAIIGVAGVASSNLGTAPKVALSDLGC